jgi:methylase of polypeptide subunit release factors
LAYVPDARSEPSARVVAASRRPTTRSALTPVLSQHPTSRRLWLETSEAESGLAMRLADHISRTTADLGSQIAAMDDIALHIMGGVDEGSAAWPAGIQDTATERPFPHDHRDVTTNMFAALAHELGRRAGLHADGGVVATPAVLARDMVALATWFWLRERVHLDDNVLAQVLFSGVEQGGDSRHFSALEHVRDHLKGATWYDPCVGGGVFPLALLELLDALGLVEPAAMMNILCRDVNPLAVAAARIRLAMSLAHKTGLHYREAYRHVRDRVRVEDSLERYAEQKPVSFMWEGDRDEPNVDIVVGNPPYVRADRLQMATKLDLAHLYPSVFSGQLDFSNYFIVHGVNALKERGVLCYVSSASFQKSRYGAKTRAFLADAGAVLCVFDFDELPVFRGASIHTTVYAVRKGPSEPAVRTYLFDRLPADRPIGHALTNASVVPATSIGRDGWNIGHAEKQDVLAVLETGTIPLVKYAGEIYSGIKTGNMAAYVLTAEEAAQLVADETSAPYVRRMLRPASIRRWQAAWDGTHMIIVPKGEVLAESSAVYKRLLRFSNSLRKRSDVRGHTTWYGLRECTYYPLLARPKMVFPDIAAECRFAIDDQGYAIPDGAFFLASTDEFLLAVLNSCVGRYYFRVRCSSIGNPLSGGRLRFKKAFVGSFPVPKPPPQVVEELRYLAKQMRTGEPQPSNQDRIDTLALRAYRIPSHLEAAFMQKG